MTAATSRPVTGWKTPATGRRGAWRPESAAGISTASEATRVAQVSQTTTARASTRVLVGDALAVEGAADLGGAGNVVREGPADEVPQRPGDAGDQGGEQDEGGEALDDPNDAGHGSSPCSAVAVPVPVTVRWSIPARERIWVGWLMVTVTVTCSPLTATVPVWPAAAR